MFKQMKISRLTFFLIFAATALLGYWSGVHNTLLGYPIGNPLLLLGAGVGLMLLALTSRLIDMRRYK